MAIVSCATTTRPDEQNGLANLSLALLNPHHQCAWCGRLIRLHRATAYGRAYPVPLPATSHGICSACARALRASRATTAKGFNHA